MKPRGAPLRGLLALVLASLLSACQGGITRTLFQPDEESPGTESEDCAYGDRPTPTVEPWKARPMVELGAYRDDDRVLALAAQWDAHVARAVKRITHVPALAFPDGVSPLVVLRPLGDEGRDFRITAEVVDGRRLPVVQINLEPIAAGRREVGTVLLQALTAAVFEDAGLRHGPVPPWVVEAASSVAAGDLEQRLLSLRRNESVVPIHVDPTDERSRHATGAAAVLVLLDRGTPADTRRFFLFSAEGDDPSALLATLVRDPLGQWAGEGRTLLFDRLESVDTAPWRLLAEVRRTLTEMGREGMESTLPEQIPQEIASEIQVLRAQGHADEGDFDAARALLASLGPEAWARLEDPERAHRLQVHAESAPGGNPDLAARLEGQWRRDYPRRSRRPLSEHAPSLEAPPALQDLADEVRALLGASRAGAARRLLLSLGERALAPELAAVTRAVEGAEASPSKQALDVNRRRVRAWAADPSPAAANDVRDGGRAAALALAEQLPRLPASRRREGLLLLAQAGDAGSAVQALAPTWRRRPSLVTGDLDALLAHAPYAEVKVWVEGYAGDVLARINAGSLWERLRHGMAEDWVRENPEITQGLRAADYATRRAAFDEADEAGRVTPGLIAWGLADPAALMRRRAVETGGVEGFGALARIALEDEAWVVRQAACVAVSRALGDASYGLLLQRFRTDGSIDVRVTVAGLLVPMASRHPEILPELLAELTDDDARIGTEITTRLPTLDSTLVLRSVLGVLEREARTRAPRDPYLARLYNVMERAAGFGLGWTPGQRPDEIRHFVANTRERLQDLGLLDATGARR